MTKVRTQLDKERQFKNLQGAGEEYLDQITEGGEEGEIKAASIITEKGKEAEKATEEDKARKIEALEKSRQRTKAEYVKRLAETLNMLCQHMDLPTNYTYWIGFNKEKLNLTITTPDNRKFGRGIIPTGMTTYDFHAIGILVTQAENTVDQIEERGAYRKDGLILK